MNCRRLPGMERVERIVRLLAALLGEVVKAIGELRRLRWPTASPPLARLRGRACYGVTLPASAQRPGSSVHELLMVGYWACRIAAGCLVAAG